MKCFICGDDSIKRHGRSDKCAKHHRFSQMQKAALSDKKYVPSFYELESFVPANMACPNCGKVMHWIDDANRSSGAVLQHYRDGSLAIVCHSCNVRHGFMPGDMYKNLPDGHKLCVACKTIKHLTNFGVRRDSKKEYPMSKCKLCMKKAYIQWKENNPEKYKALNKKHNTKRKERLNAASI